MKILIATDTYYPHVNGCSYFAQRLAWHLQERGHEVLVIAPSRDLRQGFLVHQGVRIFALRSLPLPFNSFSVCLPFFIAETIERVKRDFRPDVIHLQGHFTIGKTVLGIAEKLSLPAVGTNHFMPENLTHYLHLPGKLERLVQRKMWQQFRKVFERLHTVTSPTRTAAGLAQRLDFSQTILPVSNGIDRKKFHPGTADDTLKKKYRLSDVPTLLSVGRLDREKNIDFLIRAFARASRGIEMHLVIAGNGVLRTSLEKLVVALGLRDRVTFTGFVPDDDLPNLYRTVDGFVIAGTAELQSIVTLEAMASGLPIIGVDAVALPELIHHGENGFLFRHGDLEAAADNIRTLLTDRDLRRRMGAKSLDIVADHDIDLTIETFEDIYRQAVKEHASTATDDYRRIQS